MYAHGMIAPVVALLAWSFIVMIWMFALRIPAMSAAKIDPNRATRADMDALPAGPRNVAANYMHLMEQPTLFYAACFALQFLGQGDHPINIGLGWTYVALRVVHSLVQNTFNLVTLRFFIFAASSVALGALIVHATMAVLH